ncbi:MAG: class I SAM-dependent methyltransferase [candidate division WOR-3 bacterium]
MANENKLSHWTKDFFVKESKYWLYLMNQRWQHAKIEAKQIAKILKQFGIQNGKILEIACGNGRICTNLAKQGFDVSGIDLSQDYIDDARIKATKKSLK